MNVILVCATTEGPIHPAIADGVKVVDLGANRVIKAILPLRRLLLAHPHATLFCCMTHANVAGLIAARFLGRHRGRVIVQEVALLSRGRAGVGGLRTRFLDATMRHFYDRADAILAVSDSVACEVADRIGRDTQSIKVIPNPIDLDAIRMMARASVRHPWLDGEYRVILGVGRLAPEKDFKTLIRAVGILVQRSMHLIRLILLGEGPERGTLEREVRRLGLDAVVSLPGYQDNPWAFMARAGVMAISSVSEGFSLVLVEAMACGCPVVSTSCGSGPEGILDGCRLGPLVPVGDAAALAKAIGNRLESPRASERLRMSVQRFSLPAVAEQYAEFLFRPNAC